MVKYGKTFRKTQIKEWEGKYIDYKKLKREIKKLIYDKEVKNVKDLNDIEKSEIINSWVKEFTDILDKEIRMVYIAFSKNEKKLYKDINVYLHIKDDYTNYELKDYLQQYQELKNLSDFSLNLSKYVYFNLKALIKILKKFDKKVIGLKDKNYHIKINYIITKLEEQNSDILYLINFKMIDEVNVILEDLISCLKEQFKLNKNEFKNSVIKNIKIENSKKQHLLDKNSINVNEASNIIDEFHKEIQLNITKIDTISSEITKLFLPWKEFLRISGDVGSRLIQLSKELSSFNDNGGNNENNISMFRNNKSIAEIISFSKQNSCNIYITLYHAFLYMFSFAVIIPFYPDLVSCKYFWKNSNLGKNNKVFYGFLMMMAPLGSLVSYIYESSLFAITTKIPLVISSFGLIIGNIFYYTSVNIKIFIFLFIGRFLIGIFNLRTHNKMYIINFLLKKDVSFYLTMFHTFSMLGLAVGFLINIIFMFFKDDDKIINKYTFGAFIGVIFSSIIFILSITKFTEARASNFNITSMKSSFGNANVNKSFASIVSNNDNIDNNDNNMSNLIFEENINVNEDMNAELRNKTIMVNDIDAQLGNFNKMNNYNDTNMVSLSISELAYKEREGLHSLFSSFLVYLLIIFTTKYINESIYINLPIFMQDYKEKVHDEIDLWVLPLVFGSSCLITLFIEFALRHKNKFISEKNLLIVLFLLILTSGFILIFLGKHYSIAYFIVIGLVIILSHLIEKYATHFFYNIIPQDYIVCKIQGNNFINIISMLARIIAAVLIICFGKYYIFYDLIIYVSNFLLNVICLILFLIFYSDIRNKSISRIMNKIGKSEVKVATEV